MKNVKISKVWMGGLAKGVKLPLTFVDGKYLELLNEWFEAGFKTPIRSNLVL